MSGDTLLMLPRRHGREGGKAIQLLLTAGGFVIASIRGWL
ncbi:unnamed protein product [Arabidopsis lyrata]|nr:unnamed protein product [Arabidopsis lyrata]